MKKVNSLLLSLLVCGVSAHAQSIPDTGKTRSVPGAKIGITPKIGVAQALGGLKNTSFLGNGMRVAIDIGAPLYKGKLGNYSFGLDLAASAGYNLFDAKNGLGQVKSAYNGINGLSEPYFGNALNNAAAFELSVGPRFTISNGKFSLSPGIQVGYLSFKRDAYTIFSKVNSGNNTTTEIPLLTAREVRVSGLVLRPELELGYRLNSQLHLSLGAAQSFGPSIKNQYSNWEALPQQGATSSYDQIVGGKAVQSDQSSRYNSLAYQLGVKMDVGSQAVKNIFTSKEKRKREQQVKDAVKSPAKGAGSAEDKNTLTAPQITFPVHKSITALREGKVQFGYTGSNTTKVDYVLQVWKVGKNGKKKLVLRDTVPNNWDGVVGGFNNPEGQSETYQAQMQAVYTDTGKSAVKPAIGKVRSTGGSNTTPGMGNLVQFNIAGSCFPDLSVTLDSAKCADSNKTKVWGHIGLNNVSGLTVTSITITDFKVNNFSGPPVAVSNLVPGTSLPPVNNSQFSFNVDQNMCNKTLFIRVLITYTCALTGESVSVPCADTIAMPCCSCNYCADSMSIKPTNSTVKDPGNNQVNISQVFSISPTNIQSVTAEIIHISDSVNNEACRICDKQPNDVYHFSGTNTIAWNNGSPINASAFNSSHTFPSKVIGWQCNNQGSINFNLNIGLPNLADLSCCSMVSTICIRYSFTDKNCKTCDIIVCYTITRTPKGEKPKDTKSVD